VGIMDKARQTAEQARQMATQAAAGAKGEGEGGTENRIGDLKKWGKSSFATIVEKVDPSLLADLIIKATAAQEKANLALHGKGSPYRIAEITITATIPPQIGFTVGRVDSSEEALATVAEGHSSQLVQAGVADLDSPVVSLGGELPQEDGSSDS
jgi:hypothetical protein